MTTLGDISAEAKRLLSLAHAQQLPLRLLGELAVQRHTRPQLSAAVGRLTPDIDLATHADAVTASRHCSMIRGTHRTGRRTRSTVADACRSTKARDRKVAVFIGRREMCHSIPVAERLEVEPENVPLAELLLAKLPTRSRRAAGSNAVVSEDQGIHASAVARLLADDWGLWRTTCGNLERVRAEIGDYRLAESDQRRALAACDQLWAAIDAGPKSRSWRLRARIGERKRWYELPEEVV